MVRRRGHRLAAAAVSCAISSIAAAQAPVGGSVRGVISDKEFNTPIAGATVVVLGTKARVQTTENGSYIVTNLPAGVYTLVITKDGYVREVKANIGVAAGQLVDTDIAMAGEFEDLDEFVVQDMDLGGEVTQQQEIALPIDMEPVVFLPPLDLQLRLESPQLLDSVGVEMIQRSGASDAAAVLLLVPGATLQDGKYAVIRGLPDRYVSTLLDGVRLPTADPNKRAVKLDQFPAAVIQSVDVSKTFTPDQQGESSGGAVNIVLKEIPDEGFLQIKSQIGFNSQVKDGQFLTYRGGGLGFWGDNSTLKNGPDGEPWPNNPTSTQFGEAPTIWKWSVAGGDSWEIDDGVRVGAFGNFFYDSDASAYSDGQLNYLEQAGVGTGLRPEQYGTPDDFYTQMYDVTQGTQSIQWGGMGIVGLESEDTKVSAKYLYTLLSEDQSVLLTNTRGKEFYFPGYDPNDPLSPGAGFVDQDKSPWTRLETLDYSQLSTQSMILSGQHRLDFLGPSDDDARDESSPVELSAPVVDWKFSLSKAREEQPDQTQFAAKWKNTVPLVPPPNPPLLTLYQHWESLRPAQNTNIGWVQHITYINEENSTQGQVNGKLPFTQWDDRDGYIKAGGFVDVVDRSWTKDSFTNREDTDTSYPGAIIDNPPGVPFSNPWSAVFPAQGHVVSQSTYDISYDGNQDILAGYLMADMPINETMNIIGGCRIENTQMSTTVIPDVDAVWIDVDTQTVQNFSGPNEWDAAFTQLDILPMIGWNWNIEEDLVLRTAFAQTLARPNFFELAPVLQYEYIGAPIFIGNPQLTMSSLNNYDVRLDWTPYEKWLISGSLFYKQITNPIQYVQRYTEGFAYNTALNLPEATLFGAELEARWTLVPMLGEEWDGLAFGTNFTYMQSEVTLSQFDQQQLADYGVNASSQPMTATPDFLFNANLTYDYRPLGTSFGVFYTLKGNSLVSAANPHTVLLTPAIYQLGYGTLNASISQEILQGLRFTAAAKNLTNPDIQTQYQTYDGVTGLNSKYTAGIAFSFAFTYQVNF